MRKDVHEVIDLCKSIGLEPVMESGQYKVRDPNTGVLLFNFHQTPSDPNWHWNIRRYLRKLGLLRDSSKRRSHKRKPAIDLAALKRAQDAAAAHGQHIPTLEDLEDSTEFFTRINYSGVLSYSEDAQEEVLRIMVARADAPRVHATRQRLRKYVDAGKKGTRTRFVRKAIEIGAERGIRTFTNVQSGQQTLSSFLGPKNKGVALWTIELIDATLDNLDGLKFGEIDESLKRVTPPPESQLETKVESHEAQFGSEIPVELEVELVADEFRQQYFEALVELLKDSKESISNKIPVLDRLDKLIGLS